MDPSTELWLEVAKISAIIIGWTVVHFLAKHREEKANQRAIDRERTGRREDVAKEALQNTIHLIVRVRTGSLGKQEINETLTEIAAIIAAYGSKEEIAALTKFIADGSKPHSRDMKNLHRMLVNDLRRYLELEEFDDKETVPYLNYGKPIGGATES